MQLLCENISLIVSSLVFCKLIVFNHYRRFNAIIKLSLCYVYSATLDPLSVFSGYYCNRLLLTHTDVINK
jgi:DNA-directed RNA polymerase subunit N (RpoN/RPB10)